MVIKTLSDCSKCKFLTKCDAHVSNGSHSHKQNPDSCELHIESEPKKKIIH